MKELLRTNDVVQISWVKSVLDQACIGFFVMDRQMSILEGSANAIPQRVMVNDKDYEYARRSLVLAESQLDGLDVLDK